MNSLNEFRESLKKSQEDLKGSWKILILMFLILVLFFLSVHYMPLKSFAGLKGVSLNPSNSLGGLPGSQINSNPLLMLALSFLGAYLVISILIYSSLRFGSKKLSLKNKLRRFGKFTVSLLIFGVLLSLGSYVYSFLGVQNSVFGALNPLLGSITLLDSAITLLFFLFPIRVALEGSIKNSLIYSVKKFWKRPLIIFGTLLISYLIFLGLFFFFSVPFTFFTPLIINLLGKLIPISLFFSSFGLAIGTFLSMRFIANFYKDNL